MKLLHIFKFGKLILQDYSEMVWKNLWYRIITKKSDTYSHCDFLFSGGRACRSAEMLKFLGNRQQSSPCVWMMNYSLKTYGEIISSRKFFLFKTWPELPSSNHNFRIIQDSDSGMISSHDFLKAHSASDAMSSFQKKMSRRTEALCEQLNQGKKVECLMYSKESDDEITTLGRLLSECFPDTSFKIINIKSCSNVRGMIKRTLHESYKLSLYEYTFDDTAQSNEEWLGNRNMWLKLILKEFHVNHWVRNIYPWNFPLLKKLITSVRHQNTDIKR